MENRKVLRGISSWYTLSNLKCVYPGSKFKSMGQAKMASLFLIMLDVYHLNWVTSHICFLLTETPAPPFPFPEM